MARKQKYPSRPNGLRETTKQYKVQGKTVRKHFYGRSDKEIDNKIAEYEKLLETQNMPRIRTLSAVCADWWARKETELSPSCVRPYRATKDIVCETLGDLPVNEITPALLVTELRKWSAQGFSSKTINNRKSVLKSILDEALIAGEINTNPCLSLPLVKGKSAEKRHPASEQDVELIEQHKADSLTARMYYFMLYTGCRRGEAAALQQKHIDREGHKAAICQTVVYQSAYPEIKTTTKTEAGMRDVDLYDNVLEILPQYDDPETYVFFPQGLPYEKAFEKAFEKYRKETGVKATPHQLRHSYASMLHSFGIDVKDAQHLLGHSSIVVTQDIYTELEKAHKEELRDSINEKVKARFK